MSTGASNPGVALVLVSHSRALADGAVELAGQMAPDVTLLAAGGDGGGGLGTSVEAVGRALDVATAGDRSAVVIVDLGSALMTTEVVLDLAEPGLVDRVRVADAPFVEGAVAAAVRAQGGGSLDEVWSAAEDAARGFARAGVAASAVPASSPASAGARGPALTAQVTLRNPLGLHARPAAVLARLVGGFEATVTVDGVDAASLLELMKLGATGGRTLAVTSSGPQARAALDALVAAVEAGFGEV